MRILRWTLAYGYLERDFNPQACWDDWSLMGESVWVSPQFKQDWKGLMLDNTKSVEQVFTAVCPSPGVLDRVLASGLTRVLLFTHHPMIWDPSVGFVFYNIPSHYYPLLREREISLFVYHTPLDRNGPFSTTASLARTLEIVPCDEFAEFLGIKSGIIGKTSCATVEALVQQTERVMGHTVKIYVYGTLEIHNGMVGLVAGGGNHTETITELAERGVNTFLTGITGRIPGYRATELAHELLQKKRINLIGATHYSTEKFACIAMLDYFRQYGLMAEFIPERPGLEEL